MIRTPWYYGWNIVAAGMISQAFVFGILLYSFTFWVPHWSQDFEVGRSDVMFIFFLVQGVSAVLLPLAGKLLDSYSIRLMYIAGITSLVASLVLTTFASQFWQITVIYTIFMVVAILFAGPLAAMTMVAKWFGKRRGMAMGICTVGTSVGGLLLPPLITTLQASIGWRETNLWVAALAVIVALPAAFVIYNSPADAGVAKEPDATSTKTLASAVAEQALSVKEILSSRAFWSIALSFGLVGMGLVAVQQNFSPLTLDQGIAATTAATLVSVMALTMIVSKLNFGFFADRMDHALLFLAVITVNAIILLILIFGAGGLPFFVLIAILLGVGMGGLLPMLAIVVGDQFGAASFGKANGLVMLFANINAIGPWLAAKVFDLNGTYELAWLILIFASLPTIILVRGFHRRSAPLMPPATAKSAP